MKNAINNLISLFAKTVLLLGSVSYILSLSPTVTQATDIITPTNRTRSVNVSLSTVEIIQNNGYTVETHHVTTEDGYILELHRIPLSKNGQKPTKNHPVFFHHSFVSTSAVWVLGGANTSLPMQLADAGYDVWLANCRGNTYSRNHVSLNYKKKAFWNFSLHEIGKYDLPAEIDYILMKTKAPQLHYIGFSMGTCVFYIMASERPEYQPKIRSQISLAPIAHLTNMKSSLNYLVHFTPILKQIRYNRMILSQSKYRTWFASTVCGRPTTSKLQKFICQKAIIFSICGSNPYDFNTKLIPFIMGHIPAGTSNLVLAHFAQFTLKDGFGQYDYGHSMNLKYYNSTKSPAYNLESIQVPITLMHGKNDLLSAIDDVMRLKSQLPKLMDVILIDNPYFNHFDFLWNLKVNELINDPVQKILNKTDAIDWVYSGPSHNITSPKNVNGDHNKKEMTNGADENLLNSIDDLKFKLDLNNITEKLNEITSIPTPLPSDIKLNKIQTENRITQDLQDNLMKFPKYSQRKYE